MTSCTGLYDGDLIVTTTHELSGVSIRTDAPVDNQGKGDSFSPTDLVGVALGTCILTTMAIIAKRDGLAIEGSRFSVQKKMTPSAPRRIESLVLNFELPEHLNPEVRKKLEQTSHTCPVHRSLSPEVRTEFVFSYLPI